MLLIHPGKVPYLTFDILFLFNVFFLSNSKIFLSTLKKKSYQIVLKIKNLYSIIFSFN